MSVTDADFSSFAACSQLFSLELWNCQLVRTWPYSTLSPLCAANSLRQLTFTDTDSCYRIASGLTQLTGLTLGSIHDPVGCCVCHITGLTQLQHLELSCDDHMISAERVTDILTSLQQLRSLELNCMIYQAEFDALLTHGTQLTSFTCSYLFLEEDLAA
jgi:hypothetical protein